MTLDEFYIKSESLTKIYGKTSEGFNFDQWMKDSKDLAQDFYPTIFLTELNQKSVAVLARSVVFYSEEQKIEIVKFVWQKIKNSSDLIIQQQFGGLLSGICISLEKEKVKQIVNVKLKDFNQKYATSFVDFLRTYGS